MPVDEVKASDISDTGNNTTAPLIMLPKPPSDLSENIQWETVVINELEYKIDSTAIQPYKRVVSHGGKKIFLCKSYASAVDGGCFLSHAFSSHSCSLGVLVRLLFSALT